MSDGIKRRDFLKVIGASGAGATMFGCSTDEVEKLIPYVVPPEDVTPGIPTWYASVCGECQAGCGIWVRTRQGRAIKVEGNPNHPVSRGALCSRGHASLQGLYNPDRIPTPLLREGGEFREATWEEAEALLVERLREAGAGTLMITGRAGPSLTDLMEDFVSVMGGARVEHEPFSHAALREAARIAFGRDSVPRFDFSNARLVYAFGADFLETWLSPVAHARQFARMSAVGPEGKGRMVFLGPRLNLTGQNADDWVPVPAGSEGILALAMANVLVGEGASAGPYGPVVDAHAPQSVAGRVGLSADQIRRMALEFAEVPSLAVGPGLGGQGRNATAANLAVLVLNQVAGNVGRSVLLESPELGTPSRPYVEIERAIRAMAGGGVSAALVHETNPVYSLPPGSGFREAFGGVPFKVVIATEMSETAALADLVLPATHFLESWGDSNPRPGVYALQQPAMRPVPHFQARQAGDVLLSVASRLGADPGATTFYDYLRGRWGRIHAAAGGGGDFDAFWRDALRRGVVEIGAAAGPGGNGAGSAPSAADTAGTGGAGAGAAAGPAGGSPPAESAQEPAPSLRSPDAALTFDPPALDGDGLTLVVYPSPRFLDGRFANRPWLQELPDPVSKITWHSWVELHPDTAEEMGVEDGDLVTVRSPHGELVAPVWVYPGIRPDHVAIPTGGGHWESGRWADDRGVNPLRLLPAVAEQPSGNMTFLSTRASVEPTGERRRLATVSGSDDQHHRPIAPAVSLAALGGAEEADPQGISTHRMERHDELTEGAARPGEAEPGPAADPGGDGHGPEEAHAGGNGHGELRELQAVGGFVPVETDGEPGAFPLEGARHGMYAGEHPRWAMAIDLDKCTGCSACVTACQAENNVPWVGEEQVIMGREMHWIRLERYYEHVDATQAGPVDVRHLPMLCQHCGNAPCEPVCPVYAAYHTPDGINAQVYNRCVGTRYCANNCPYKVRVFNWYTFTDVPEPMNWQYNPDVTVRENGVMEKCTFCVHKIRQVQNRARVEGRRVLDGDVVPACQATCPAEAIVFGDIRNPESRVSQVTGSGRTYRVLDDLINTQPAVSYLKKVTFHSVAAGHHGGFYGEAHGAAGHDGDGRVHPDGNGAEGAAGEEAH